MDWGRRKQSHHLCSPFIILLLPFLPSPLTLWLLLPTPFFPPRYPPSVPRSSATLTSMIDACMDTNMIIISDPSHAPANSPVGRKLEPLLEILSRYFNTSDDLRTRIQGYYKVFDADQDGELSFQVMQGTFVLRHREWE